MISLGEVTQTMAERKLRDYIRETQVGSPESFMEVTSPTTTFKQQAQWWLDEMRAGRIVSRRKRKPIKPATLAGYEAAVNWLKKITGETPLADIAWTFPTIARTWSVSIDWTSRSAARAQPATALPAAVSAAI